MEKQPLVSIIIPVYKAEKYLRRCLESVQNQTYQNIEVILVDDGSPDKCPQICDEYAKNDPRFHVIHKENGGISSARNAGLDYCTNNAGGYICFLDDDDWLPLNSVKALSERLIETNADMSWGSFAKVLVSGSKKILVKNQEIYIENKNDLSKALPCTISPWGKMYRADIISKNVIRFPVDVLSNEDTIFIYDYLKCCVKISFLSDITYYWNHLNYQSYSRSFSSDVNLSYAKSLSLRKNLLYPYYSNPHEWIVVLELLHVALLRYANCESPLLKIEETYRLFAQFIQEIDNQWLSNSENGFAIAFRSYCDYLKEEKFDLVFQVLSTYQKQNRQSPVKKVARNILLPIEQFFVFRLNLFYK